MTFGMILYRYQTSFKKNSTPKNTLVCMNMDIVQNDYVRTFSYEFGFSYRLKME